MDIAVEARRAVRGRARSRTFLWAVASQGTSSATNLALTLLAARVLGPGGLGVVFVGFACYLLPLGFQRALLADPLITSSAALDDRLRRLETGSALTVCVLGALVASAVVAVAGAVVSGEIGRGLLLFAPFIVPALLQDFWRVVLFRESRGGAAAGNDAVWLLVMVALVPLAVSLDAIWAVAACWGTGAVAGACLGAVQTGMRPERPGPALVWWREKAWPLGRWLGVEGILWTVGAYGTIFLLAGLLGPRGLGGLRAVQSLFAPLGLLAPAVSLAGLPELTRELASSAEAARRLAVRLALGLVGLAVVYACALALGSDPALQLVFGELFTGFAGLAWPLGVAQVLAAAPIGFVLLLKAHRRGGALVLARALGLAATLGIVWPLATLEGIRGAAWGLAAGALVGGLALTWLALRPRAGLGPSPLGSIALRSFRLLSPAVYRRLRTAPFVGDVFRHLLDVILPAQGPVPLRVAGGPLVGLVLELDPRLHKVMLAGRYEPQVERAIQGLLTPGDTAYDVGAHLGYFSLTMATRVGGAGRVVAFEPDPAVAGQLQRNLGLQDEPLGTIVVPVVAAVGARPGRIPFTSGADTSTGRLSGAGELEVDVTTLDEAAERFGEPRLVKIDVEGAELDVLRGGPRLLGRRKATFVVETHSEELERECVRLLESLGYRCGRLLDEPEPRAHIVASPIGAGR